VELISPERFFAPEVGGMNHVPYMRAFQENGVRVTVATRVTSVRRDGNALIAVLGSDFAPGYAEERHVDQVVVEHGTAPLDALYLALKPHSRNLGAVDHGALTANPGGRFRIYRIGDAVASRNIHAGIYDALRYGIRW
jgi:pyruvate/2-oxoglutarate dehydrogenase complex dihydrolipoamide dehydrogenase (E3) component